MPRDMFGDVSNPSVRVGSQKWYTVPVSIAAHVVLFAGVIIIPLMAADVLPTPPTMMAFVGAPPPPPPPPPPIDIAERNCSSSLRMRMKYRSLEMLRPMLSVARAKYETESPGAT